MNKVKNLLFSKLAKDTFVYTLSDILNKAVPFLLLPVLTYYLSTKDYGQVAIFNSYVIFFSVFVGLSTHGSISVNYYKYTQEKLAAYIGNVVFIVLGATLLSVVILLLIFYFFPSFFPLPLIWILVAILVSLNNFLVLVNLTLWLAEQKPLSYGILQITETLLKIGLSLFFIIACSMAWEGRAGGIFCGSLVCALASLILLKKRRYLKFSFNKAHIEDALKFGIPLVPHQLSFWLKSGAILFVLTSMVSSEETGLYSVALQLSLPISVLTVAFNNAWAPYLYRKLETVPSHTTKTKIVGFTYLYFICLPLLSLLYVLMIHPIASLFLPLEYTQSLKYTYYLVFSYTCHGFYLMVVNYIFYTKKTKYLAYITFFSSALNVVLAYVLISKNGTIGAAQSTLISSCLTFGLVWYYSNKVYKMPWYNLTA